eukprot:11410917-Alexandrium_andersonii.AAC.1
MDCSRLLRGLSVRAAPALDCGAPAHQLEHRSAIAELRTGLSCGAPAKIAALASDCQGGHGLC